MNKNIIIFGQYAYQVTDEQIKKGDECVYFKQDPKDDLDKTKIFTALDLGFMADGRKTVNCSPSTFYFQDECKKVNLAYYAHINYHAIPADNFKYQVEIQNAEGDVLDYISVMSDSTETITLTLKEYIKHLT